MEQTSDAKWDRINNKKRDEIRHGQACNIVFNFYFNQGIKVWANKQAKEGDLLEDIHTVYDIIKASENSVLVLQETRKYGSPVQEIKIKSTDLDLIENNIKQSSQEIEPEFTGIKLIEPTKAEEKKMDFDL